MSREFIDCLEIKVRHPSYWTDLTLAEKQRSRRVFMRRTASNANQMATEYGVAETIWRVERLDTRRANEPQYNSTSDTKQLKCKEMNKIRKSLRRSWE